MVRKVVLPILAFLGLVLGIRTVVVSNRPAEVAQPVSEPPRVPFQLFVAGSGIIEASSENIAIASPVSGVIQAVNVAVGQPVKKDEVLFRIDDREAAARLVVRRAAAGVADKRLQDREAQFDLWQKSRGSQAVSEGDYRKRKYAVEIAKAALELAQSELRAAEIELERLIVRAPIDGTVLQLKARVGEFAAAQVMLNPLLILGDTSPIHVRVEVDENDAWRVRAHSRALAFLRGNSRVSAELEFVRFEPHVVPKKSLTGESAERVDTRVLQLIYRLNSESFPVYIGQLVDVYIESET
jgi:RND family efflux transporter MFP subunit